MEEVISANISAKNYKELKEKYPGANIDGIIEKKVKYYRIKPFKKRFYAWWCDKIKEFIEFVNEDYKEEEEEKKEEKKIKSIPITSDLQKIVNQYYGKEDLSQQLLKIQPMYYDENRIWWIWNKKKLKWEISDETNVLNFVRELSFANTIKSNEKQEILEALKQESRLNKPKPIKKTWIQFKSMIYDINDGSKIEATPEYFVTNPIPWDVSGDPRTPVIDKIFNEWVGEKYIKTLYEIIAYCLISDYPIHRLFCLIGAGLNGKGCFLRLLSKFIGEDNITSTELDVLLSSRFEVTRLHKKLVCMMGETNFNEMNQTSILKKLTGQDVIGFEYKNKTPFTDNNYAKILIATNNLPTTTDKTIGFYRRWLIIDFPNHFSEKKDILADIPEEEYNNLATNCICVLTDLLKNREFTNEGAIEDRMKRYEDRSDPLEKFIKEFTEEDANGYIFKFDFEKQFSQWCKENKFRSISEVGIGKKMKEKGISQQHIQSSWLIDGVKKQLRAWIGIKWRNGN